MKPVFAEDRPKAREGPPRSPTPAGPKIGGRPRRPGDGGVAMRCSDDLLVFQRATVAGLGFLESQSSLVLSVFSMVKTSSAAAHCRHKQLTASGLKFGTAARRPGGDRLGFAVGAAAPARAHCCVACSSASGWFLMGVHPSPRWRRRWKYSPPDVHHWRRRHQPDGVRQVLGGFSPEAHRRHRHWVGDYVPQRFGRMAVPEETRDGDLGAAVESSLRAATAPFLAAGRWPAEGGGPDLVALCDGQKASMARRAKVQRDRATAHFGRASDRASSAAARATQQGPAAGRAEKYRCSGGTAVQESPAHRLEASSRPQSPAHRELRLVVVIDAERLRHPGVKRPPPPVAFRHRRWPSRSPLQADWRPAVQRLRQAVRA